MKCRHTDMLSNMTTTPRPDAADEAVRLAEEVLAEAATALIGPAVGECLLCYVHRMLTEFGCDTSAAGVGTATAKCSSMRSPCAPSTGPPR